MLDLTNIPPSLPNLQYLNLDFNPLTSLQGLSEELFYSLLDFYQTHFPSDSFYSNAFPYGFYRYLDPEVIQWAKAGNYIAIHEYYSLTMIQLCQKLVAGVTITPSQIRRFHYELTSDVRTYLDQFLPEDSPYREQLEFYRSPPFQNKKKILL